MKRILYLILTLAFFFGTDTASSRGSIAQKAAVVTQPAPRAEPSASAAPHTSPSTPNTPQAIRPGVPWFLAAHDSPKAVIATGPHAPDAVTLGGDWSNDQALACITPLGIVHLGAFSVGATLLPPFDLAPSVTEYAANLALKLCAPVLYPPGDFWVPHQVDVDGGCQWTFSQPRWQGLYKNYLGFTLPWGDVYPGKTWGDLGGPDVFHHNTYVDVSVEMPAADELAGDQYFLPAGTHIATWRAETLRSPLDYVPKYIPGWAWTRMNKLFQLRNAGQVATETTLESVLDVIGGELSFIPSEPTMYNEEIQRVAVTDRTAPLLDGPAAVELEAIEPGGLSRASYLAQLRRTLSVSDNCDSAADVFADQAHLLPEFVAVGQSASLTWLAEDDGPYDLTGARNRSNPLTQTFTVGDTLAPIILPPPDIVTEAVSLPAVLQLGHPATFDLADLSPAVSHNACTLSGVECTVDEIRFPAGKTTVTWTAVDSAGNSSSVSQIVNVKSLGSNRAPTADDASADAISYEPITITLQAGDPDGDRLWFEIGQQPPGGFFHSPLYPYFIQDYRLANVQDISFSDYCADPSHRQQYIPTNWPVQANFMAVADDGTVYVHDYGMVYCTGLGDVSKNYRLAVFRPDGSWEQTASASSVHDVYVDWQRGLLFETESTNDGVAWIREYDLDLNRTAQYRLDRAVPAAMAMKDARQGVIDEQGVIYVTNGFQFANTAHLRLYTAEYDSSQGNYLQFLADYSISGAVFQDLALDSEGNLYASDRDGDRIYKWSPATLAADGSFTPGQLIGWLGRCDSGPGCDQANGRSFGYSCNSVTCSFSATGGTGPGQFDFPRGIAVDNSDILYVTDYYNQRVQRFTPEGFFAGQAISECDGSCFVLGDFGAPKQVTVNASHFYVLDDYADLLHVFETSPITRLSSDRAEIVYQSDNNFVGADSFTYWVSDGLDHSAPATVSVNVTRNYRPPTAIGPLAVTTLEDVPVSLPVDGYDPDGALDTLSFQAVDAPQNGTFAGQGKDVVYQPDPDFEGTETFSYAAYDGRDLSPAQAVTVTITPVNDAPRFPESDAAGGNHPSGFALRPAGSFFSVGRLAPLGTAGDPLRVGRGFSTVINVTFEDPDIGDVHTVSVDWGDGSPVEEEGRMLEDGTMTGPILSEGTSGGTGSVTAEHTFSSSGSFTIDVCISDNVAVDDAGNKILTPTSTTRCRPLAVEVGPMVDLLVDIRPSANPYPAGSPLSYELVVINRAPDSGAGLTATGMRIVDTLDTRLSVGAVTTGGGACSVSGVTITCDLDPLAPGESTVVHIAVQVPDIIEPGMVLANHVGYLVDQENQANVQENGDVLTVVAPADFVVSTLADDEDTNPGDGLCAVDSGACSLRAAVQEANGDPSERRTIALADWQLVLGNELFVTGDVEIVGLGVGRTIVGGNGQSRLFNVTAGGSLILHGLTLQGGSSDESGGALYNAGTAHLATVQVSGNHASHAGGALYNVGTLTLTDSAITGNLADQGAGAVDNRATLRLENVTISGNRGINGGIVSTGNAILENLTLTHNHGTGAGGLLATPGSSASLRNTILAGNISDGADDDCWGDLTSLGYNLVGEGCAASARSTDIIGQSPRLGPLERGANNTMIHRLLSGSPAVDAGDCRLAADQLGTLRPVDGDLDGLPACDIGAVEFRPYRTLLPLILR